MHKYKIGEIAECAYYDWPSTNNVYYKVVIHSIIYSLKFASGVGYEIEAIRDHKIPEVNALSNKHYLTVDTCWLRPIPNNDFTELFGNLNEFPKSIQLKYCGHCKKFFVECPRCGNNSCNGTYGDVGKCKTCIEVYDIQNEIFKNAVLVEHIESLLLSINKVVKTSIGDINV